MFGHPYSRPDGRDCSSDPEGNTIQVVSEGVPRTWIRRPLSILALLIGTLLSLVVGPIALVVATLTDVVTRTPGMRRSRVVLLITELFFVDLLGRLLVLGAWLISPVGLAVKRPKSQARYGSIMTWWTNRLIKTISRIVPMAFDTSALDEALLGGDAIVVSRHRSLLDAVYPAVLFGNLGLTVLYTLKEDLRWEPNIDIVGHRMGHVFVTRSPNDLDAELEPIRHLATRIDENSVGVIFPEGTFFNETRKAQAVAYLEERDSDHVAAAQQMQYLLPPRPAGTLALLDGAPEADVIMLGHAGFEPFGTIRQILSSLGADHRVAVRAWRFARSGIPVDPGAQIDWLFDRWLEMDAWICNHHQRAGILAKTSVSAGHGGS
jgi:1-acyl-sn-glycerol-3-phosphate acyltransferase